ncbi:Uncharacterized protein BM_BM3432 [Brugia malayi]|uniref:Bm3432, isoform a n=1 Tax=Brugia malayi TaxID=6279 RepID=A0A1P6BXQ8_BRUMA|nr:Uncharacterized protein BM_BM3432 [Brugia malayi]CRZ24183.1 Bm3432, isoform b [Brugia malayi]VIO94457.1 Uncharacterized protein BM_BM3432 [Brugia malayi]
MPSISALSPHYYKSFRPLKNDDKDLKFCDNGHSTSTCYIDAQQSTESLFRLLLQSQTAYAQYVKLITLFIFAVIHVIYMVPFLSIFAAVASNIDVTSNTESFHFRHFVETLTDYNENMWIIVSSMCVALSTSCFILMPNTSSRKIAYDIIRGIDFLTFGTLPFFLVARLILLNSIFEQLPIVIREIQLTQYSKQLSAALHCSFIPVKEVPLCDQVIRNVLFPAYIIKFLTILAILTVAYMLLAYLIEWCLKHWFPPQCNHSKHASIYAPIAMVV